MMQMLAQTADALRARGFDAVVFSTAAEAAAYVRQDIPAGQTVAIGGSMTVQQMNLHTLLRADGHPVLWHWEAEPAQRDAVRAEALHASAYLCSANALTEDGLIVQIDGNGNRVAAMCYGPKTVYVLVGRNKLVQGGYAQAVRRIKQEACPRNARRQGLNTPCAQPEGACRPAQCTASMCHVIAAFELSPAGKRTQVVLIDEDLGY